MRKLVFLVVFLAGCSQSPIKAAWDPGSSFWERYRNAGVWLEHEGKRFKFITPMVLDNLLTVQERLEGVSFERVRLALAHTDSPNAFATVHAGKKYVVFSLSFLDALGRNRDALAVAMGHEMAHLRLEHGKLRRGREAQKQVMGFAMGLFLGPLAEIGTHAAFNSFSKEEERDADAYGMKWAVQAGFDPCGYYPIVDLMSKYGTQIPLLSTHPGGEERAKLADEHSQKVNGRSCN